MRKERLIIGIDPGLTGAIAAIGDQEAGTVVYDMPVVSKISSRSGNEVNPHGLADLIVDLVESVEGDVVAFVERVSAMPNQGVSSMFSFGDGYGIIRGVLGALDIPIEYVSPQRWKKALGLSGSEKDAARTKAIQLYPDLSKSLGRKKDIGRADALLIAHYGATCA